MVIDPIAFIRRQHKAIADNPTGSGVHVREREFQNGVFEKVGLLLERIELLEATARAAAQTLNAWAEWDPDLDAEIPRNFCGAIQHAQELQQRRSNTIAQLAGAFADESAASPNRG